MLVKFFNRGTGKGSGAVDYLLKKTDPITKELREPPPLVLGFGNQSLTANIIDSLKFKHKYRSGVLSFAPEDAPTEEEQRELMADFEEIAFAGIAQQNRDILWVRHQHTGSSRVELHFIAPRVELSTGKSLNIAPPGWQGYFKPWRKKWNLQKGWADPDDPARARVSSPGHTAFEAKRKAARGEAPPLDTRARATASVESAIASGQAKNRNGVLKALEDNGFEVVRATNKSVTIKNQEWGGDPGNNRSKVRLKSQVFYKDWTLENQLNPTPLINTAKEVDKLDAEIKQKVAKRRDFNIQRYKQNVGVEAEPQTHNPSDYAEPAEFIAEVLGERAIIPRNAIARNRQELESFKSQISLVDYAITQGFTKIDKESSANSIKLRHPDDGKIIVKPGENDVYFAPNGSLKSGTVIDFVQQFHQVNLGQARKILRDYLGTSQPRSTRVNPVQLKTKLPQHVMSTLKSSPKTEAPVFVAQNYPNLRRHDYLERRGINPQLLQSDRFKNQLKLDKFNNAVFPYKDSQKVTGYELRNTNFKGFGSGGKKSLWQSNQKSDDSRLVIVESPIDALSFHQLHGDERTRYLATGGTISPRQQELIEVELRAIAQKSGVIIFATDNDEPGNKLAEQIDNLAPDVNFFLKKRMKPKFKDWNEDLIAKLNQKLQQEEVTKRRVTKSNNREL